VLTYVARATPVHQQAAATKLEQELEAAGIIQKIDKPTAWTSPGFFVPKPNWGVRLVTDYAGPRGLNSQILRPTHPFPAAHDIVQAIPPTARYFATADCVHGYFQLALDKESKDLTTFMLPSGRWQYLRGPMGLSATCSRQLLKKEKKWIWSFNQQDAFNAVVKILTFDLVLINFDPSKPTILLTDASRLKGLGFALGHTETIDGK
jgi:hypothetical protein